VGLVGDKGFPQQWQEYVVGRAEQEDGDLHHKVTDIMTQGV